MQEFLQHFHYDLVVKYFPLAGKVPVQFVYVGGLLVASVLVIGWMSLIAMGWIWAERKVSGYIQCRIGPNRVGPYGLLQSLADGIKLLSKEDIIPTVANRFLYELAPLLVFAGAFIPFAVLPFSQHLVIADMDLGVFYVLAFGALEVVGILMAGWAPNSKWSLYGGMRLAAQMLSYEIPLGLSVLTVIILSGSLNLTDITLWQTRGILFWDDVHVIWPFNILSWSIFRAPLSALPAFIIFFVAGLAESKRAPFDLPEAESELVAGFHTEYTGMRFAYFFLAEYCAMYVICLLGSVVFLGGWSWPLPAWFSVSGAGPGVIEQMSAKLDQGFWSAVGVLFTWPSIKVALNELSGFVNLVGKSFVLLFVMLWVRWTLPRIRIDQVMHICLKVLLPFGLACIVLAAAQAAITSTDGAGPAAERRTARQTSHEPIAFAAPQQSDESRAKAGAKAAEKAEAKEQRADASVLPPAPSVAKTEAEPVNK